MLLNTGAKIPSIGLGTWRSKAGQVEAVTPKTPPNLRIAPSPTYSSCGVCVCVLSVWSWMVVDEEAVTYAIDEVGYRHVDGAWAYGNEKEVGNAIRACKTPRSEVFVTVSPTSHNTLPSHLNIGVIHFVSCSCTDPG